MKKILSIAVIFLILIITAISPIYATTEILEEKEVLESDNATKLSQMKEEAGSKLAQYTEKYGGSEAYGLTAMILDTVRIYSIPFCFVGITIGAIYQYIIVIRRLDIRDRGFNLIIAFVTILVIAQILPLVFAIVTRGWVL